MTYTPPDNDAVNFSEDGSYSPPANDAVNFNEEPDGQTETASGTVTVTGSASPTFTQTASASGSVSVSGDYTKIFRPSASGSVAVAGSASATVAVQASASGATSVLGAASPTVDGFGPIEDVASTTYLKLVNPSDESDTVRIPDDAFEFIEGTQNREHTAVNDWGISVKPRDDRLTARVFDKVVLVHRGVQFGVGRLLRVDPDYSDEEMALEGYGRLYEMRTEPARKIYKDTPYFRAIDDFLGDAETVDAYTVVEPTPQTVLDNEEIVNAPAVEGFDDIAAEVTSTTPILIDSTGGVSTKQTCIHRDGNDRDDSTGSILNAGQLDSVYYVDDDGISGLMSDQAPTSVSYDFTVNYTMPANAISIQLRRGVSEVGGDGITGDINVYLTPDGGSEKQIGQKRIDASFNQTPVWMEIPVDASEDLPAGAHTLRVELQMIDGSGTYEIDRLAFYDDRFEYDFDSDASNTDSNGQIAGPELYPDAVEALLVDDALGSNIETVDVSSTFVDGDLGRWALTVGAETLEAADGDANPSFDADANDAFGTGLQLNLELGRKGTRTDTSPTEGFEPEQLTDLVVNVSTNDLRVIEGKKDYLGTEFDVLKKLCDESRYRFRTDPRADLGVVDIEAFRPEDRRTQPRLEWEDSLSASVDAFDYFNAARGLGRRRVGDRISAERVVDDEIADKGVRVGKAKTFSRAIADKAELRTELEKYLAEGVSNYNRDLSGTAYLQDIQPGGEVFVPVRDEFIALERVRVDFASETMDVEFDYTRNDANAAATLNAAEETETRQSIGFDSKDDVKDALGLDDSAFTDEDAGGEEAEQPSEEGALGDFAVSINSTNSPVLEYDTVEVNATVTNNDTENAQQGRFTFSIGGTRQEVKSRTVGAGEAVDLTFRWQTDDGDKGDYTAEVASGTDSDTEQVTVEGFPEPSGDFGVNIIDTNSPVIEGEILVVTADITNNDGGNPQEGTFVLEIGGEPTNFHEDVEFDAGETKSLSFVWQTEDGDGGETSEDYTAEVLSGTDSDTEQVTVEESEGGILEPGAVSIRIDSAPDTVEHGETALIDATVTYFGGPSAFVNYQLSVGGVNVDVAPTDAVRNGESRTRTLSFTPVEDTFPAGDYEMCARADREGVGGRQDTDCANITVQALEVLEPSGSAADFERGEAASSKLYDSLGDIDILRFQWDFTAMDDAFADNIPGGDAHIGLDNQSSFDGTQADIFHRAFGGGESGSGTEEIDVSDVSGTLYLLVDDGSGSVAPP